jgi:hypothetical protein
VDPIRKICKFNFGEPNKVDKVIVFLPVAVTKRLTATWTPELAQDVSAFHNIDVEAELTRLLTENLVTEINTEILNNYTPTRNIIPIQPLDIPVGHLYYLDYDYTPNRNNVEVYNDGSWSYEDIFEGSIGVNFKMKPHTII